MARKSLHEALRHQTPHSGVMRVSSTPLVTLLFTPGSNTLEATHAFLMAYISDRCLPHVAQRIALAAHELLANAMSYASMGSEIRLEITDTKDRIVVRVENQTIPARISMLRDQFDKVRGGAEAAFLGELKRSISGGATRPMLGLARIAHEGRLSLEFRVEGTCVSVAASCPV